MIGAQARVLRIVPILTVTDLDSSSELYVGALGLEEVMRLGWVTTLKNPATGHQLSLMTTDATAPCNPDVSVEVDDVDVAYKAARTTVAEIVHELQDEDWGVRRFFFRDPAGNVLNVLCHQR